MVHSPVGSGGDEEQLLNPQLEKGGLPTMGRRAATAAVGGVQVSGDETSQLRSSGCLPDVPLGGCLRHVYPGGGSSADL